MAGTVSFDFAGARAWVTGASRGLGRDIALALADAGARVALSARESSALDDTAGHVRRLGADVLALPASVDREDQVAAAAERIRSDWGGLDILVNCAGISPSMSRSQGLAVDEWRTVLDVNLTGTFLCSRAAHALMVAAGGGSIVNVSSIHGQRGMARLAAYSASKGGIDALTRSLALEWADDGIRVNCVSPGYIETDMTAGLRASSTWSERLQARTALGRLARTNEITPTALFLASEASAYTTGAHVLVDGGWSAS